MSATTAMMGSSSSATSYIPPGEVFFNDGREEQLLKFVQQHPDLPSPSAPKDPHQILRLIDEFGHKHNYLMNVGSAKGKIVTDVIAEHKPACMIELGGYVGYSTILFADAVRKAGGRRYISFERDPKFAKVAGALVELAGLAEVVRIVVGSSSKNLVVEHANGRLDAVDMVFLDHYKPAYVRDLKICESLGVVHRGTVLAADNVISPGNPPYLEYVRSSVKEKKGRLEGRSSSEKSASDGFRDRTVNQYKNHTSAEDGEDDTEAPGDPSLVYESRLIHSQEPHGVPDGIEVTVCTGP